MKRKRIQLIIASFLAILLTSAFVTKKYVKTQVKDLFKMNKTLQEEGYYMADFEFRMLSVLYNLDNGKFLKSLSMLSDYHTKLSNKKGLIKIPEFRNNQEEINFYLSLQNPNTGAFVDESVPYYIYWPVTENVLNHLEDLQGSSTMPIKLKYRLTFLDSISSPENLETYLNDMAYVGWLAPKFPMTSFFFVRELISCAADDNILVRNNLYDFSPEWKRAFTRWIYEFQDAETGMWGPKNRRTKELAVKDLDNTASLAKHFRDNNGNDLHKDFPLQYKDKLFNSTLEALKEPYPDDDDLTNIHAWNLKVSKGMNMLLRYLWKDASDEDKKKAQLIFANIIKVEFEKYYVKGEGAFSYYPDAGHASCDGITNFSFNDIGALSYEKQKKYWGEPQTNIVNLGSININNVGGFLDTLTNINSLRMYVSRPSFSNLTDSVWAVIYPQPTVVLDVMEIVPNIVTWTETSTLSLGNWKSMADIKNKFSSFRISKPLIFTNGFPHNEVDSLLNQSIDLYLIGYDVLQIPRFVIEVTQNDSSIFVY